MQPTRRTALAGAAAATAIAALAGCTPSRRPSDPTSSIPTRTPSRTRSGTDAERGFNVSPRGSDYAYPSPWTGLWSNWDWVGKIRRDIDLGVGLGGTIVRIVGAPEAVISGALTQDTYLTRTQQVLDYCRSIGVRYYPAGGTIRTWRPDDLPASQLQDLYVAQTALLEPRHADVFGFDINNELTNAFRRGFDPVSLRTTVGGWARAIKQAAPSIPVTVSNFAHDPGAGYVRYPEIEDDLDFFDFHLIQPMSERAVAAWVAHKPVVIGEVDVRRTAADRAARYRSIIDPAMAGGAEAILAWDIASNDYGLYDARGQNLDSGLAAGFASVPGRRAG